MRFDLSASQRVTARRFVRYGSVSAISTVTCLAVLGISGGILGLPAIWSNVLATTVATVPSFELNKRWMWAQRKKRSIRNQAIPYFLLSLVGLIISTIAVHVASDATSSSTRLLHTMVVEMANVGAYGALWLLQFALCDRILFRSADGTSEHVSQALRTRVMEGPDDDECGRGWLPSGEPTRVGGG